MSGVLIQGIEPKSVEKVLNIRKRLIQGEFTTADMPIPDGGVGLPGAMIGKALAKKFSLKVGQPFKLVIPMLDKTDAANFTPRVKTFFLNGIFCRSPRFQPKFRHIRFLQDYQ